MQGCALHMRKKAFIRFIGLNLKLKFSLAPRLHRVYAPGRGVFRPPDPLQPGPPRHKQPDKICGTMQQ